MNKDYDMILLSHNEAHITVEITVTKIKNALRANCLALVGDAVLCVPQNVRNAGFGTQRTASPTKTGDHSIEKSMRKL